MRSLLIMLISFLFAIHQIDAIGQTYGAGACSAIPGTKTCADATPCKLDSSGATVCLTGASLPVGAVAVPQTCWQYTYQYACGASTVDNCRTYSANSTCSVSSATCGSTVTETGKCAQWIYTYSCLTTPAQTEQQTVCSSSSNLFNASLAPTPSVTNNNAAQVAVANEIARQVQVYGQGGGALFSGVSENCSKGYYGMKNCCTTTPSAAQPNSAVLGTALGNAANVVKFAGSSAIDAASPYVFDAMYSAGGYTAGLAQSMTSLSSVTTGSFGGFTTATGTNLSASGLNLGAYGMTFSTVGPTGSFGTGLINAGGTGMFGADTTFQLADNAFFTFNPYSFAASVAIQFAMQEVQKMMACTQQEQLLGTHRGANLSVYVNQECTSRVPIIGTCIAWQENYCSFNSILGKIINQQGKAQLGLNFSNCSGLTVSQIQSLNFSAMDLSQFTNQMTAKAQSSLPNARSTGSAMSKVVQDGGTKQSTNTGMSYPSK